MAWICEQEGIEADAEALAVLAQAGEGSVRDSLSALDQAIACCGARLEAAEVRGLLGAFSLESLEKVTEALAGGNSQRMLEVVDELERNGRNLQHFSRELARYFRNLLVARITAGDSLARLVAASAAEREKLAEIAGRFSEEDLTRYLQLSLDLFRDLQFSLQPRFHLELGLVRLVQAGRLMPIEQALAELGGRRGRPRRRPSQARGRRRPRPPAAPPAPPKRTGPSPFELDRAKKAGAGRARSARRSPAAGDAREKLHAHLTRAGADASGGRGGECARWRLSGSELQVTAPKSYLLYFNDRGFAEAVARSLRPALNIKVTAGESGGLAARLWPAPAAAAEDEAANRALANPEVRRFREVFGGEVRKVRNLKE